MRSAFLSMVILAVCSNLVIAEDQNPVQTELKKKSVWTGEGMPLVITLFSPGPFSGTASFDFPELTHTVFIAEGSPLVGSEEVDGESYLTQRHDFTIYTQRSGEIEIPSFQVRFSGKKTFTSDAVPMQGTTHTLMFTSKRPPGLAANEIAVVAESMQITESWSPESFEHIKAGDVIQRSLSRRATGTTAMMLPPVKKIAPEGVRVYLADPTVLDKNERGSRQAERDETIKYQFERPGAFTLPELKFKWWDPKSEEYQHTVLKERTVTIEGLPQVVARVTDPSEQKSWLWVILCFSGTFFGWYYRRSIGDVFTRCSRFIYPEEAKAASGVIRACLSNDAAATYVFTLDWMRAAGSNHQAATSDSVLNLVQCKAFHEEWTALSQHEFGSSPIRQDWSGVDFVVAFQQLRRDIKQTSRETFPRRSLPELNPATSN